MQYGDQHRAQSTEITDLLAPKEKVRKADLLGRHRILDARRGESARTRDHIDHLVVGDVVDGIRRVSRV
jgi:hypothetical protein